MPDICWSHAVLIKLFVILHEPVVFIGGLCCVLCAGLPAGVASAHSILSSGGPPLPGLKKPLLGQLTIAPVPVCNLTPLGRVM